MNEVQVQDKNQLASLSLWSDQRINSTISALAATGMAKSKEEALARMLVADALGVHPITGVINIHLMDCKGKVTPIVGVHLGTARHQQMGGTFKILESTDQKCRVCAKYLDSEYTSEWTVSRLKPLDSRINKDNRSQLLARAKAEAIRAVNPAAFMGVYTREEIPEAEEIKPVKTDFIVVENDMAEEVPKFDYAVEVENPQPESKTPPNKPPKPDYSINLDDTPPKEKAAMPPANAAAGVLLTEAEKGSIVANLHAQPEAVKAEALRFCRDNKINFSSGAVTRAQTESLQTHLQNFCLLSIGDKNTNGEAFQ